ncbi:MAG TPA: hypothetical protein VJ829_11030 [Candidatus Binatia bacterium]|nr:hypothetical protein [Candidatus Binatia bacterium]
MNTLGIAVATFGSAITDVTTTVIGPGLTLAEMLAGLGAATVATLGVLIVRVLNAPNREPAAPIPARCPQAPGVKQAA